MAENEDIDSLLAQLQAEQQNKLPSSQFDPKISDVLDDTLARIKKELKDDTSESQKIDRDKIQFHNSTNPAVDNLFENFKADFAAKKADFTPVDFSFPKTSQQNNLRIDSLLNQIKAESQQQKSIDNKITNQQNITEIQQKELNAQKQRRINLQQAEIWLKSLDPNSEEWLWFEQFAYSYESKVEAAIDYLKALGKI
jgi:hypothetical protein